MIGREAAGKDEPEPCTGTGHLQKGHATATRDAPVPMASCARSTFTFLPTCSSIHMRAPPAPQHMPRVPLRGISTMSMPASEPITLRGARYTSLWRPR